MPTLQCNFDPAKSLWPSPDPAVRDPDRSLLDPERPLDPEAVNQLVAHMCQYEDDTSDLWRDSLHNVLLLLGLHDYIHSDIQPPVSGSVDAQRRWGRERAVARELMTGTASTLLRDLKIEAVYDANEPKFQNPFHLYELIERQMGPSLASGRQIYRHAQMLRPDQFADVSGFLCELDRLYCRLDYHGIGLDNPIWVWHCLDVLDRADPQWRRKLAVLEKTRERKRGSSTRNKRNNEKTKWHAKPNGNAPEDSGVLESVQGSTSSVSGLLTPTVDFLNGEASETRLSEEAWNDFDSWRDLFVALATKTCNLKLAGPERKKTNPILSSVAVQTTNPKKPERLPGGKAPSTETKSEEPEAKVRSKVRTKENRAIPPKTTCKTAVDMQYLPTQGIFQEDYGYDLGEDEAIGKMSETVVIEGESRRVIPGFAERKKSGHALRDTSKKGQQHFFRTKFPGRPQCEECLCQHPLEGYLYCLFCDFCHEGGPDECWATKPHLRGTRPMPGKYRTARLEGNFSSEDEDEDGGLEAFTIVSQTGEDTMTEREFEEPGRRAFIDAGTTEPVSDMAEPPRLIMTGLVITKPLVRSGVQVMTDPDIAKLGAEAEHGQQGQKGQHTRFRSMSVLSTSSSGHSLQDFRRVRAAQRTKAAASKAAKEKAAETATAQPMTGNGTGPASKRGKQPRKQPRKQPPRQPPNIIQGEV